MPDNKARVAILISGEGTNMAALLYASHLPDSPYDVVLVASNNPDAPGVKLAEAEGVPTFAESHKGKDRAAFDAMLDKAIRKSGADYVACAGYMRVLSDAFVDGWKDRLLNIHPSLLPKYPGLDTHQRALDAGDTKAGCTVHLVTSELDSGPVLGQAEVAIVRGDTAESLASRIRFAEHQLYPQALAKYVSRGSSPDWLLGEVRKLALALPETHERPSHGNPGWRVGTEKNGKYFAHFADRHHGSEHIAMLVKTDGIDEMMALIDQNPDLYFRPDFYGASGWIGVKLNRPDTDWNHVAEWLEQSWRRCAPKSMAKLMNAAEEF